jgi:hypothetical protein
LGRIRGGFPVNLTNIDQKIAVLGCDASSNFVFHQQITKFLEIRSAKAQTLSEIAIHIYFSHGPSKFVLPASSAMGRRRQIAIMRELANLK